MRLIAAGPQLKSSKRLYSLDALRGIAALSIIFWHWQHMFFNAGLGKIVYVRSAQPLYPFLRYLYHYGDRAVTLFFVISGFVFYWLYAESIGARTVSPRAFVSLRISRLFPLHVLTFALVIGLQAVYSGPAHVLFVYPRHDLLLAVKTLLGVASWLPNSISGFNGPFWSVSIELLLYLIFFLTCRFVSASLGFALVMVFLGLALHHLHPELSQGLKGFFMGGVAYHVFCWIRTRGNALAWVVGSGLGTLAGWVALAWLAPVLHMDLYPPEPIFAGAVVFAVLAEHRFPTFRTGLSVLGDISYSVYLLHFPLQLVFVLVNRALGGQPEIFYQTWTLLLFLAVLVPLAFLSYHGFELPALRFLRGRLERPKVPASAGLAGVPVLTDNS